MPPVVAHRRADTLRPLARHELERQMDAAERDAAFGLTVPVADVLARLDAAAIAIETRKAAKRA